VSPRQTGPRPEQAKLIFEKLFDHSPDGVLVTKPDGTISRATAPARRRSATVLIVEDNFDAAESLAEVLAMEGHRVEVASDGRSGIAKARARPPEVIVCDIGLPDVDGYELARTLRADPALRATRLIALSGYAQPEDRERARAAGFELHFPKPAPLEALLAALVTPP
jgi:CheY-like chemotaxis protein